MQKYKITVTAASGVESAVKNELRTLGFPSAKALDGGINVDGTATDVARLNMFLSCADRVYITLCSFKATTFDELFDGVSSFPFGDIIPFNARIIVNGKCRNSRLFAVSSCQSVVKKAILTSLSKKYRKKLFPENGEYYRVEFVISSDEATVMLNTSGDGLHKRGWRDLVGEAPIKENLACAMLSYSDFSPENPFCDPFCGSGTIVIEAARKALGIAPGKNRGFDYAKWDFFDGNAYKLAYEEALDKETPDRKLHFYGFDVNPDAISLASRHAVRAGVRDKIHLQVQDVKDFRCSLKNGCMVTNPPYGERLLTPKEAAAVYRTLGEVWRNLDNWSLFAITCAPDFEKNLGKKCDKNRKLYNSGIECRLYQYFHKQSLT
ncbi:MAG: class I SAM-dependent RNA methyltransferase [Christensenellales bacterium]